MVQGYRVLTWLSAYVDMVLQGISLLGIGLFGYTLILTTMKYTTIPTHLLGQWFTLIIEGVFLIPLSFIGCKKLIQATETSGKPDVALKLTHLWWYVTLISMVVAIPSLFVELFVKAGIFYALPPNTEDLPVNPKTTMVVFCVILFPLYFFMLFCVFKFRQEMKSAIPHSMTHVMTPLDPQGNHNDSKKHHHHHHHHSSSSP